MTQTITLTHTSGLNSAGLNIDSMLRPDFWQGRFPQLSIGKHTSSHRHNREAPHRQSLERIHERMMKDGYFGDSDNALLETAPKLGDAVQACVDLGLPPVFVFVCDEAWESFFHLHPVLTSLLGDYRFLPDFWAWHIDPQKHQSGWTPHRDKGGCSLAPDGSPLSLTLWIPLTEANTLNSCIYMVPSHLDPTYNSPKENELHAAISSIRALPARPGDYLCWNQAVFHWGSPSSPFAEQPRMSIALECQRNDIGAFNQPLLAPLTYPDFPTRLRLIAKQILQYQHMYGFSQELRNLAQQISHRLQQV